jgi:methylsterol monooxygenase
VFQVIGWVLFNQVIVGFPVAYLSYLMMKWRGSPPLRELPTFHWVLAEMAVHILMEEIGFYYSHRYCFVIVNV